MSIAVTTAAMEGLPLLGYATWWRLSGIKIEHKDFSDRLEAAGFRKFTPKPVTYRKALSRALREWLKDYDINKDTAPSKSQKTKSLIRPINEPNKAWMVFGLIIEAQDLQEMGFAHTTGLRILLSKKSGNFIITSKNNGLITDKDESDLLRQSILPYYERQLELVTGQDVSSTITKITDNLGATSLRSMGGLYYIADSHKEELDKLAKLVENLSDNSQFVMLPILDIEQTRKQIAKNLQSGLLDQVTAAKNDLLRLVELAKEGRTVRQSTITKLLDNYKELKGKASFYADKLEMRKEEILEEITDLQHAAHTLLGA